MSRIYFNNAACAYPLSTGVVEAVAQTLASLPRISGRDSEGRSDSLEETRVNTARLLDGCADRVVLTSGATFSLNTAILGLGLKPSDLVIATVMEHNSVLRPLARLEDLHGIRVAYVPLGPDLKLDETVFGRLLKEQPRLVVMSHASNVTGRINPVRSWFDKAKSVGAVTLLDASQTVGKIPVIPRDLHADLVAFSGYKGLRGPLGTGVLYVAPEVDLNPTFVGGTGVKADLRLHPQNMPMRLEAGTPNVPAFAGLNAALSYWFENMEHIASLEKNITEQLLHGLTAIRNVRVFDEDPHDRLPVVSFVINGMDSETAGFALSESFGIECRSGLHCAPRLHEAIGLKSVGTVRFSPSYLNTDSEIDTALEAVRRLAG